jgi:hypothetical protein
MTALPPRLYINVYEPFAGQTGTAYTTREAADMMAAPGRLACVEVDLSGLLVRRFIHATRVMNHKD